jgi:hypothetical protein
MTPISSTQSSDFVLDVSDPVTQPYEPDRSLVAAATAPPIIVSVTAEGMGGVADYSLRVELPCYDDHLRAVSRLLTTVNELVLALNWREP